MSMKRFGGLLAALLMALVTVGITLGSASPAPPTNRGYFLPSATATSIPTAPATLTPVPTSTAVAPPTTAPTAVPLQTEPSSPAPTDLPKPTQIPDTGTEIIIGTSVEGRPITASRIGDGPIKIALIGDIHGDFEANTHLLVQQLLAYFRAKPDQVPTAVSLWFIPTMNPDGLATGHRWNANDVDLNRNADTDLDGCAGNDWSPDTEGLEGPHPGAGGPYPFSEPESRAVRDFLEDASIAVFYHSAAEAIFVDACQRHVPTAILAQVLSDSTGYEVPVEGWAGYPITGDLGDYLAGEGVAAVTVELTDHENPEFERNLEGVRALLADWDEVVSAEALQVDAETIWLDEETSGSWQFPENSFIHPIALEVLGSTAYLLDGGRILALNLDQPTEPRLLLASGEEVAGVRVLEPLDLSADGTSLLALDRAGDVYRYDPAADSWAVERYDRPPRDTYDHYFVALTSDDRASFLLETSHEQVWRFAEGELGTPWIKLPQNRDVDVGASGNGVYVLTRAMNSPRATLLRYRDAQQVSSFQPNVDLMHPRQVVATDVAVYVLDRSGHRLLSLDPASGALLALYQFPDRREISVLWAEPEGSNLILAGRDAIHIVGHPERQAHVPSGQVLEDPQPHDLALLDRLRGLAVPIEGARITARDFQLPGAPRHYRLGVHEGIDFYGHTVGVPVDRRTAVHAVADGTVIRAMVNYQPVTASQAEEWYAQSRSLGYTPPEVLDGYRGMQVWIDHGDGVVSRYAHLGSIEPGIVEGTVVTQGEVIAMVGNSGTPGSLQSKTNDVHLHLELWVGDHFAGQFLRPIEAREWLEKILR